MKEILVILLLIIGGMASETSAAVAPPDSLVKKSVIVRKDTVTVADTVVRRRLVERLDTVKRTEVTIEEVTYRLNSGSPVKEKGGKLLTDSLATHTEGVDKVLVSVETVDSLGMTECSLPKLPVKAGGDYIWVPDSLKRRVESALNGEVVEKEPYVSDSYATFRGDTIPMVLRSRNFGRFDRGLFNHLFIPKGIWQFGATASYGEFSTKDLEMFDLLSDIDFSGSIFSIKPYVQYFIGNNMSVGLRMSYTSGKANIDSFKVDIDEDMNFNLHDIMYKNESYSASLLFNQYFGITQRGRFGIFNEVELAFSSGNSDFIRPFNGEPKHTHSTTMAARLNFSPGVSVFIMEPVSFNVSFGVFGFSLRSEKQMVDGVDMGRRLTSGANFRFNIFNINFGIAVNI